MRQLEEDEEEEGRLIKGRKASSEERRPTRERRGEGKAFTAGKEEMTLKRVTEYGK